MGVDEYKQEFYLEADLQEILSVAKIWLKNNQFKIKEEIPNTFIKSFAGSYLGVSDRGTRRWLEINVNHLPTGNLVSIYERVAHGGNMFGQLIKEEVLGLMGFLQTNLIIKQASATYGMCAHCHAPIKIAGSKFCESCGRPTTAPTPTVIESGETCKFCIYCGEKIPAIAVFCEKCGAHIK